MTMITAVEMEKRAGLTPEKFRKALRKSKAQGASDLSWHHHNDRWEAQDGSDRHDAMMRVLREISN